jgi:N6-adenosine-specific RNA methylase IME4
MHSTNTNMNDTPDESRPRRYRTIVADPPWPTGQVGALGASRHYQIMTIEQIERLPVSDLAEDNAHLYLWCYPATRYLAEDIMRAWGFRFVDEFVWGKDQMGLGQYFRHAHETLLLGVRGKLPAQFHGQRSFTMLARQGHSHKPEEILTALIPRMSPGPYLELFARRPTHGWDIWSNEVESDIRIPGYPVPSDRLPPREATPDA